MGTPAGHLATFVHISDLHIGELDPTTGHATLDAHTEPWIQNLPWFDGYLGHGGPALRHLHTLFHRLRREEKADLIVTGDFTTVGKGTEFDLARRFLESDATFYPGLRLGLNVPDYKDRSVTGNHDQWPGRRPAGPWDPVMMGAAGRRSRFRFPAISRVPLPAAGGDLVFIRMDSDADVGPKGSHRLFARARFSSQLSAARGLLPRPQGSREFRVLLLHHSPACKDFILGMSPRMRNDLESFLEDTDTRVVLTGHVHKTQALTFSAGKLQCLEARCGTTTQRDRIPSHWPKRRKAPDTNTLLVHRLVTGSTPGTIDWSVETYVRDRTGFNPDPSPLAPGSTTVWT